MKHPLSQVLGCTVCCIGALAVSALAAEKNPPGDIPDDQVFVAYTSRAGGYSLKVPEGWARTEKGSEGWLGLAATGYAGIPQLL